MKKVTPIITLLTCFVFQLFGAEYIQIKETDGPSKYSKILEHGGSISNVHEFHIGAPEKDITKKLYAGYKINYQKAEEKLILKVTSNTFEGFVELEKGKFSPLMTTDSKQVELSEPGADWIEIRLKRSAPMKVKWVHIENLENEI